jgi:hypothetical protein
LVTGWLCNLTFLSALTIMTKVTSSACRSN